MSEELVKRLLEPYTQRQSRRVDAEFAAADRIKELEAKLAEVGAALRVWIDFANVEGMPVSLSDLEAAELTGGKDD